MSYKDKIAIIKAIVNKKVSVNIIDNNNKVIAADCYIYSMSTNSCVVTTEFINDYVVHKNWDGRFRTIKYDNISNIKVNS